MTPWGYIWVGLGLLAVCGMVAAVGISLDDQVITGGALLLTVFPTVFVGIGVVGQGVKVSRNR
jgi:hypothetical protein